LDRLKKDIRNNKKYFDTLISFAIVGVIVILILYGTLAYTKEVDYEKEFCKFQGFDTGYKVSETLGIYEAVKCSKIIDYQVIYKEFYIKISELKRGEVSWEKVGDINCIKT